MKIKDECFGLEQQQAIKQSLIKLINQPSDTQSRPCPDCHVAIGENQSISSTEHCSWQCPMAAKKMSSAPLKYPIEQNIVPLVYAFYSLRLMMPCWSCEGHNDRQGQVLKAPKLWFYTSADFYAKLVAQYVSTLKGEGRISNSWAVVVLPFSQSMFATTYSLEPQEVIAGQTQLSGLHQDIKIIAANLRGEILRLADVYIAKIDDNQVQKNHEQS